jgi:hypothetical protein
LLAVVPHSNAIVVVVAAAIFRLGPFVATSTSTFTDVVGCCRQKLNGTQKEQKKNMQRTKERQEKRKRIMKGG